MHAIAQKCRPKHQVLVLKCYPRTTKGTIDVKPNSSELSYLLYYATSRRSKIQKVGSFLERKTASDVWRQRIGNVQVTLKILEALIEKNPKDLPLFAPNVLKILDVILRSNDITMVESSIPTFEAFCSNHDASTLLADQFYLAQFEAVVRHYASFASTRLSPGKSRPSKPVAMRWRSAGLEAIKAVAASDALSSIAGRQYDMMVPMILENLWTDNEEFLDVLLDRAETEEKDDNDRQLKRRNSVATVRTADTAGDTNPIALSGTAMDVDKLAEQDLGVLAILCLKQIFISSSRSLIHYATLALLDFVKDRIDQGEAVVRMNPGSREGGWSVKICGLLLRWAPVQERYIILITVMDALARTPLSDETLNHHITLTTMIGSLLRSEESLIGLSVMDVLLGFIQHIKKLVQMPGDPAAAAAVAASEGPLPGRPDPRSPTTLAAIESVTTVASQRKELLTRLQQCIGDLATHVYYADQIADMVSTILYRMKPPRSSSGTGSSTPPGEKAAEDTKTDNEGAGDSPQKNNSSHQPSVDSLFSLSVAKTAVLRSIKAILLVANPKTNLGGNQTLSRNRVPIQVWEGTHWLLRDPDGQVRKAYVDALITWLDREVSHSDQRARDDSTIGSSISATSVIGNRPSTKNGPAAGAGGAASNLARRAVSSASNRGENGVAGSSTAKQPSSSRRRRTFFLSLLHLAIYDNALQFVDYETDIVLLHVLLYKLVDKLGVNATRYGLPMIFQLQEAIQDVETPQAKVRVGSLVHGYFWTLTEKFRFETTMVGHAIRNEVTRRRSKHFWVEGVHVPPNSLLELVGTPGMIRPQPRMPLHEIETEALLPFDDRLSLVENICAGYQETAGSPPQSPAISPSRGAGSFNFGIAGSGATAGNENGTDFDEEVPASYKSQMLSDWSRDAVIQAVQQSAGSKSVSLSGSRTGTMATSSNNAAAGGRTRLMANTSSGLGREYLYANDNSNNGPSPSGSHQNLGGANNNDNLTPLVTKLRKSSIRSGVSPSPGGSLSSRGGARNGTGFVTSVDQLKMALSGAAVHANLGSRHGEARGQNDEGEDDDDDSSSMASYDISASEFSFNPPQGVNAAAAGAAGVDQQQSSQPDAEGSGSSPIKQVTSPSRKSSTTGEFLEAPNGNGSNYKSGDHNDESVPPVPPLPSPIIREQHQFQAQQQANAAAKAGTPTRPMTSPPAKSASTSAAANVQQATRRNVKSRGGESILSSVLGDDMDTPPLDLTSLLKGIDSRAGENGLGNLSRPPY
ncbi:plasma membrane localization protein [Sporothrix stenoceras]|uniref:Plasma membrane localization protein n=1 Tax=Sporothrix stenoceras TaxID=5173 RepID=A0ABR3YHS2_9PEZI